MTTEFQNDDAYLRSLAIESARQRVKEFRDNLGWDQDDTAAPLCLLAEILLEMHKTAGEIIARVAQLDSPFAKIVEPWLLPREKPAPVTKEVADAAARIRDILRNGEGLDTQKLTKMLHEIYEAGEKAGFRQAGETPIPGTSEVIGQRDIRYPRPNDEPISDLYRDPARMEQCSWCGLNYRSDANHVCSMRPSASGASRFVGRSFGDRG